MITYRISVTGEDSKQQFNSE